MWSVILEVVTLFPFLSVYLPPHEKGEKVIVGNFSDKCVCPKYRKHAFQNLSILAFDEIDYMIKAN